MDSPILRPVPTPQIEIIAGTHKTAHAGTKLQVEPVLLDACFISIDHQAAYSRDLRELAQLFTEMADIMEDK